MTTEKLQRLAQYFSADAEVIIFADKAEIDSFVPKVNIPANFNNESDSFAAKLGMTSVTVLGRTIFFAEKSKFVDLITPDAEPEIT